MGKAFFPEKSRLTPKDSQNVRKLVKIVFFEFWRKSKSLMCTFLHKMKDLMVVYHSEKTECPGKIWFAIQRAKRPSPNGQNVDFFMNLDMLLKIHDRIIGFWWNFQEMIIIWLFCQFRTILKISAIFSHFWLKNQPKSKIQLWTWKSQKLQYINTEYTSQNNSTVSKEQ